MTLFRDYQGNLVWAFACVEFSDVAVAHAIQLAVAPVFLLTGIGFWRLVTNGWVAISDRARVLEDRLDNREIYVATVNLRIGPR